MDLAWDSDILARLVHGGDVLDLVLVADVLGNETAYGSGIVGVDAELVGNVDDGRRLARREAEVLREHADGARRTSRCAHARDVRKRRKSALEFVDGASVAAHGAVDEERGKRDANDRDDDEYPLEDVPEDLHV